MRPLRGGILFLVALVLTAFFSISAVGISAFAQVRGRDAGLVTKLSGEVTYRTEVSKSQAVRAEPFMKTRQGDRFDLPQDAVVQLVYFQSGRQEIWKGPAAFEVGAGESSATAPHQEVRPEVTSLPAGSGADLRRIPVLMDNAQRYGGTRVARIEEPPAAARMAEKAERSSDSPSSSDRVPSAAPSRAYTRPQTAALPKAAAARPPSPAKRDLGTDAKARMERAKETYRTLRAQSKDDDITPELYLIGALAENQDYGEMESIIQEAMKRQPGNEALGQLREWVRQQARLSRPVAPVKKQSSPPSR